MTTARSRILGIEAPRTARKYSCERSNEKLSVRRTAQCDRGIIATSWLQEVVWPTEPREYARISVSTYRDALLCIEHTQNQPVPSDLFKTFILGMLSFIVKTQKGRPERDEGDRQGHRDDQGDPEQRAAKAKQAEQ